ncbi:MAG: glycosyltransferase family 39 protein, partial [Lacibacter sp.]
MKRPSKVWLKIAHICVMLDKCIPVIASRSASFIHKNAIAIMLILVIAVYLFNGIQYIQAQSITYDEGNFYNYAVRYLKGNPDRINPMTDDSKMPVSVLNTIPRILEQLIEPNSQKTDMGVSDIIHGRYITLFFSIFILLLIFIWTKELYGKKGALFAAFLFSFCPNNMALATLVTTDSYSVFFLLLSIYLVWKFCKTKSIYVFLFLSFSVAVSQLVKQSLFHLYILVPFCLLSYFISFRKAIKDVSLTKLTFLFILINLVVINAGYYFYHSFMRLGEYHFMSNLFLTLQKIFPESLPIPFPKPFIDGLDMGIYY